MCQHLYGVEQIIFLEGFIMKAIIENRVYDTETATLIASDDNGYPSCDFRHMEECLYQMENISFTVTVVRCHLMQFITATA